MYFTFPWISWIMSLQWGKWSTFHMGINMEIFFLGEVHVASTEEVLCFLGERLKSRLISSPIWTDGRCFQHQNPNHLYPHLQPPVLLSTSACSLVSVVGQVPRRPVLCGLLQFWHSMTPCTTSFMASVTLTPTCFAIVLHLQLTDRFGDIPGAGF